MTLQVLSLGAGIQSSALLLMSDRGEVPRLDCAIFADTGWEPREVYDQLAWLEETVSIPIHRVTCGRNIREDAVIAQVRGRKADGERWASMPIRTVSAKGEHGMMKRQCTSEYKIAPIERFIRRSLLGLRPRQHAPKECVVDHWYGISSDEAHRMKASRDAWQRCVYPLCNFPDDFFPRLQTRHNCYAWLRRNYPAREFVRSACIGCPYKGAKEWRRLKQNPKEWGEAVEVDEAIRHSGGTRGEMFLHRSGRALAEANLDEEQMEMWGEECAGVCGV